MRIDFPTSLRLRKTSNGGLVCDDDPGEMAYGNGHPRGSPCDEELELLRVFCSGRTVLEIGTGLGVSSRAILASCKSLTSVDNDPWVKSEVVHEIECDKFSFYTSLSEIGPDAKFDVVFIDGGHSTADVISDMQYTQKVVSKSGMILVHDLFLIEVLQGLKACGVRPSVIDTPMKLGVVIPSECK